VSTDHLIDSLWAEDPPKSARNSVQRFVSDLRKTLGDENGSLLRTQDGGYLFEVADGELDIDVFESLALQGREALDAGHAADATSIFQMALGLWTGVPFGDLQYANFARTQVARLEESRIAVVEDRVEAELALAHHADLIGELESLTAEHPYRERLWGQLMVALYRAGRQAEALRTYQKARSLLGEELGIDPSVELQQLEEQILLQDPSLTLEVPSREIASEEQIRPAVGRAVRGYEMREEIGSGTFGVVYRAYQASVGREVAIKVIRPWYANNPEFIRRFENEAQLVARLEHPHIVPLYDFWREGDGAYLAMRWMRAGSLEGTLRRGPWSVEAAGRLISQVGAALRVAHRHGISHGDVKPANILLDDDGNAYLSDFGIAADLAFGATNGAPTSSPSYYSPEQLRNEPATPQTDIFGLGLVLFELLTGHHPFPDLAGDDLAA
ncbi:MAG: BTAD domain-containing putative transcriptional regulator, partial [Acidimicrobiia bacterium]